MPTPYTFSLFSSGGCIRCVFSKGIAVGIGERGEASLGGRT